MTVVLLVISFHTLRINEGGVINGLKNEKFFSMNYLIRFLQVHETFRRPEVEALATLANVRVEFEEYSESVCFRSDRGN